MRFLAVLTLSGVIALAGSGAAFAGDPESCKTVKFSDVGWTDITATTAIASEILKGLGYTPKITVLSVPVTYASMKNKDIDVFLGNWQPSMENDRKPYIEDKSVIEIGANLPTGTPIRTLAMVANPTSEIVSTVACQYPRFAMAMNATTTNAARRHDRCIQ